MNHVSNECHALQREVSVQYIKIGLERLTYNCSQIMALHFCRLRQVLYSVAIPASISVEQISIVDISLGAVTFDVSLQLVCDVWNSDLKVLGA